MKVRTKIALVFLFVAGFVGLLAFLVHGHTIAILDPQGPIGAQERDLLAIATGFMLVVVIPVFAMTFYFMWKYREGNAKAKYLPDWEHNRLDEVIWWAVPGILILILAGITWVSTHELDPYKPLESDVKPLTIDVVAESWKWLFIYPDQHIATVNDLEIPIDTPINFRVTADAPMNSFWIPQLGGQIYAMTGMTTQLHLQADKVGDYNGYSANFSGKGFAGMDFMTHAVSQSDFDTWVATVKNAKSVLSPDTYATLAKPSENNPIAYYGWVDPTLFDTIEMQYMKPATQMGDVPMLQNM